MPKGRGAAAAALSETPSSTNDGEANGKGMVKTTLFLSENLDANLAYMSLRTQKSKAELVRKAVEGFLTEHEYDPMKKPKITPPTYD